MELIDIVCGYLATLFSCICYVVSNDRIVLNDKLQIMWKEEVMYYVKVQFLNFYGSMLLSPKQGISMAPW
jgi:hypothetical protein